MGRNSLRVVQLVIGCMLVVNVSTAARGEEFFKNKSIRFLVGSKPGGGFDIMTRAIARHISKHIPGNPSTIVDYMPGAGHLILVKHMYEKAEPDGLTIGNFIGQMILSELLGLNKAGVDFRKFGWLGIPMQDHWACALSKQSGIGSIEEWKASKNPVKIGGDAPGNGLYDFPRILSVVLDLPTQVIAGYRGSSDLMVAIESGEIHGGCWTWQVMRTQARAQIAAGDLRVVLQAGPKSYPDLKDVPLAIDYAKTKTARELIEVGVHDRGAITRPYSVPPNVPQDRLALLQNAFMLTMKDRGFLEDAKKLKLDIDPLDGPTTARIVARSYDLDPALLSKLKQAIQTGRK